MSGVESGDYHELTLTLTNSGDGALHFTGSTPLQSAPIIKRSKIILSAP